MLLARLRAAATAAALLLSFSAQAAGLLGADSLHARHASLGPQLANNAFGGPLVLASEEQPKRMDGDVYAVLEHPFATVSAALSDPSQWCGILILHLNTKYCRRTDVEGVPHVEMRVGKKTAQSIDSAKPLDFTWRTAQVTPDYLSVQMDAAKGPSDTSDYRIFVEAVPLESGRTFLHMGYGMGFGGASQLAMRMYLSTAGSSKVGFTRVPAEAAGGKEGLVGGVRGIVERNTMRYYFAIDAYLDSLAAPAGEQLENRLRGWFDATEKFPRQLHEVERDAYLRMKRSEVERQSAAR